MTTETKEELVLDLGRVALIEDPDEVASAFALLAYRWSTTDTPLGRAMDQVINDLELDPTRNLE